MIAQELGLNEAQVYEVRIGSLLHDVGKIGIADAILKKEGKLTVEEYEAVADVFDAMTSNRPYRKALAVGQVTDYPKQQAEILFDGACVQALERIIERVENVG